MVRCWWSWPRLWDGSLVADAIARAARITVQGEDAQAALGRRLAGKHILLVIDNCEHLVRPVAPKVLNPRGLTKATIR
jgi:predicted ATPase